MRPLPGTTSFVAYKYHLIWCGFEEGCFTLSAMVVLHDTNMSNPSNADPCSYPNGRCTNISEGHLRSCWTQYMYIIVSNNWSTSIRGWTYIYEASLLRIKMPYWKRDMHETMWWSQCVCIEKCHKPLMCLQRHYIFPLVADFGSHFVVLYHQSFTS